MSNLNDGFSWFNLSAVTLTNAAQNGASVTRKPGMFNLTVMGVMTDGDADNPTCNLQLQGSMDGTNWTTLASSGTNNQFTGAGTTVALGIDGGDSVDCQRFKYLRPSLQVVDTSGGTTWSVAVKVSGVGRDGAVVDYSKQTVREASNPYVAATNNGATQTRMAGLKHLTCQVVTSAFTAGGATVTANFQISPDSGTTWLTIATQAIAGTGSFVFVHDNSNLIDLGGCNKYRVQVADTGGNTTTAYTYTEYFGGDASDWLSTSVNAAQQVPEVINDALLRGVITSNGAGATPRILTLQLTKLDGTALGSACAFRATCSDVANTGTVDLAANCNLNSATVGSITGGAGSNSISGLTNANGKFSCGIIRSGGGAAAFFINVTSDGVDSGSGRFIFSAPELNTGSIS
jgi:hypothetical protein